MTNHPQRPRGVHRKPRENYSFEEADDRIYDIFRHHGFGDVPHAQRRKLTQYYQLLMSHQQTDNITRLVSLRDVAIKHFIDSLIVARLIPLPFPLLDVGTGPGFPGIPLKVLFPEEKIVLAEGVQRRVGFLKTVRDQLDLTPMPIIGRYVDRDFFYPVQGVITRAVEETQQTLGNVLNCLQKDGRAILMKGPHCDDEIEPALRAWGSHFVLEKDLTYTLPQTPHERRLLIFRKTQATAPGAPAGDLF